MEGTILRPPASEPGMLRGADNRRYGFDHADWKSEGLPRAGDRVDFEPTGEQAREIYRLDASRLDSRVVSTTSPLAVISLIAGILGLFWFGSIIAIICGHIARASIRDSKGTLDGDSLALAGLVLGYIGLLLWLGVFLLIGSISLWSMNLQGFSL